MEHFELKGLHYDLRSILTNEGSPRRQPNLEAGHRHGSRLKTQVTGRFTETGKYRNIMEVAKEKGERVFDIYVKRLIRGQGTGAQRGESGDCQKTGKY